MEILNNDVVQLAIWAYVLIYGIAFGVVNSITVIKGLLTGREVIQRAPGKLADATWYVLCFVLLFTN